jgi:hypothetical protein
MGEPQVFAARTNEHVALAVEREVVAGEDAVGLSGAVAHRNMRFDPVLYQPRQHAAGTVGGVCRVDQVIGAVGEGDLAAVTASKDKTARLWEAATGKEVAVLRGHDDQVYSAAFSPDGARVVTASWDKTARL